MPAPNAGKELIVGIDLGTTYSSIAYLDEEKRPTLIPVEGQNTMPSVVLFESPDEIIVGKSALLQATVRNDHVAQWIKRSIGEDPPYVRTFRWTIDGKEVTKDYTAEEISAEILKKVVREAQAELGQPIRKAVITCPAWFEDRARKATQKAGELAGLEVLRIVNEPTAAAIYYGLEKLGDGETVLVYDLGGGTFDSSILRYNKGELDHLASVGDRKLGGHDWTEILVGKVAERLEEQFGENPLLDPTVKQHLYEQCEGAKRNLARMATVTISCVYQGRGADAIVTQAEFEEWTDGRLQLSLHWTQEAVLKAKLTWANINHVLLVGGSTRLRRVVEALTELAGKAPIQTNQEDIMVALGAAALTGKEVRVGRGGRSSVKPFKVKERTPHALGLVTLAKGKSYPFQNTSVIDEGSPLPAEGTRSDLKTLVPNQDVFDVAVLQGKDPDATKNQINYTYRFKCPPGLARGSSLGVTLKYNESNQIEVQARDMRTGQSLEGQSIQFQWPVGGGRRTVDVCFVVDCTGSMAGCINGVKQEIGNFCNELATSDFDYRLALVEYRDLQFNEPTKTYDWTNDVARFREWVSRLVAEGGGDEPESALDGLASGAEMAPRQDASQVLILVTDATAHVPDQKGRSADDIADLLKKRNIKVFGIAPRFPAYITIAERTGGKLFDFNAQFTVGAVDVGLFREVLHDVGQSMINTLLSVDD